MSVYIDNVAIIVLETMEISVVGSVVRRSIGRENNNKSVGIEHSTEGGQGSIPSQGHIF